MRQPSSTLWGSAAALIVAVVVAFLAGAIGSSEDPHARLTYAQAAELRLAIDADITNGVCTTIDAARTVEVGDTYRVAVCVENLPQEIDAFDLLLYYDDTINFAPEVADVIPALDDNPDANVGATTFSSPDLGSGWDCSGFGAYFPTGDQNPSSGPGNGHAFITCDDFSPSGHTNYLSGRSLPLAVIEFVASGAGTETFTFADLCRLAWESETVALCDPESGWAMPCTGATITNLLPPTATPTSTPSPTPSVTPSPTPSPVPTATPTPFPDGDGGGAPDFLELAVGGDPSDPADDAAIMAADSDGDACANAEELPGAAAPAPGSTGAYDPLAWYDFYDVPVPAMPDAVCANGLRNQAVAMDDVLAVLFYVGTYNGDAGTPNANGVAYDVDKDSDTVKDGQDYDRSPSAEPNPPWDAGPPDGAVAMGDVLAVLAQVGLACSGEP